MRCARACRPARPPWGTPRERCRAAGFRARLRAGRTDPRSRGSRWARSVDQRRREVALGLDARPSSRSNAQDPDDQRLRDQRREQAGALASRHDAHRAGGIGLGRAVEARPPTHGGRERECEPDSQEGEPRAPEECGRIQPERDRKHRRQRDARPDEAQTGLAAAPGFLGEADGMDEDPREDCEPGGESGPPRNGREGPARPAEGFDQIQRDQGQEAERAARCASACRAAMPPRGRRRGRPRARAGRRSTRAA